MSICLILFSMLALLMPGLAGSTDTPRVSLVAVLGNKVVLEIDKARYVLSRGQRVKERILLVESDYESALIESQGERWRVKIGDAPVRANYAAPPIIGELRLYRSRSGLYRTLGRINGKTTSFLVDTGASSIAMSEAQAKRLHIDYKKLAKGKRYKVRTANGPALAYPVVLNEVQVGGIKQSFVPAMVIEGDIEMKNILLGMSFLKNLRVFQENGALILQAK